MAPHTYTGIFAFTFIEDNNIIYKYTSIQSTDPRKYKTIDKLTLNLRKINENDIPKCT